MLQVPAVAAYEKWLREAALDEKRAWWSSDTAKFLEKFKLTTDGDATHTGFIGGRWCVPFADEPELHAIMAKDLNQGIVMHLTERVGSVFKFFIDLDFEFGAPDIPAVDEISPIVQASLPSRPRVITSIRTHWKVHMNIPGLIVTAAQALDYVSAISAALSAAFPHVPWDKKIDRSVFTSGLRMFGHAKPWGSFRKAGPGECVFIADGKWCDYYSTGAHEVTGLHWNKLPRTYTLHMANCQKARAVKEAITAEQLNDMSILVPDAAADSGERPAKQRKITSPSTPALSTSLVLVSPSTPLAVHIGTLLKIAPGDIQLHKAKMRDGNLTIPTVSKTCAIADRVHSSNHIYCVVNSRSIFQSCHNATCKMNAQKSRRYPVKEMPSAAKTELQTLKTGHTKADSSFRTIMEAPIGQPEQLERMDLTPGEGRVTAVGSWVCPLPRNRFCPVCQTDHDSPENYFMVNQAGHKCIGCHRNPFEFWPDPVEKVNAATINVLFSTTIINNNYGGGEVANVPDDDIFPNEPIFEDCELNALVFASMKGWEYDIAKVFIHLAGGLFGVQQGEQTYKWWCYNSGNGCWRRGDALAIQFCRENLYAIYVRMLDYYEGRPVDELLPIRIGRLHGIMKRLRGREQNGILHQAAVTLAISEPTFVQGLNTNKDLLNFNGIVHDLATGTVRSTLASDMLTMSTGYSLPSEVDIEERHAILDFIKSIMADDEAVAYLLTWLASCLDGYNSDEIFTICTGAGRNGKGVLRDLMHATLGEYAHTVQAAMFTHERPSSSSPCPDLLHCRGKRFISGSEPEKGKGLNTGFLKMFTGNDIISGRFLNENEEQDFYPQHSVMYMTNRVPAMDPEEEALWLRSRILDFPFVFVKTPKKPNEKCGDDKLKIRAKTWGSQFMLILLERYHTVYKNTGLPVSRGVSATNKQIRRENEPFAEWLQVHVVQNEHAAILRSDTWDAYRRSGGAGKQLDLYKALDRHCGGNLRQLAQYERARGYSGWDHAT